MSRDGSITLPWADGKYMFRLGWGELEALQEACDVGPYIVADRLRTKVRAVKIEERILDEAGRSLPALVSLQGEVDPPYLLPPEAGVKEISAVIRLGLIGGGMSAPRALQLVNQYVERRPPEESRVTAFTVLTVGLYGAPEEKLGEGEAPNPKGETLSTASQTES